MRIVNTLRVALTGLAVIGAVSAYAQMDKRSQYEGSAASVVDDKGNLRVPFDYRTPIGNGLSVLSSARATIRLDL